MGARTFWHQSGRTWLEDFTDRHFGRVDFLVGLLAENAETLGEPYTRHLGGKVRELRFHLLGQQTRVTYRLASGRRLVLTQPALSRLEAGGSVPTIPVLERISAALDADLIVTIAPPRSMRNSYSGQPVGLTNQK